MKEAMCGAATVEWTQTRTSLLSHPIVAKIITRDVSDDRRGARGTKERGVSPVRLIPRGVAAEMGVAAVGEEAKALQGRQVPTATRFWNPSEIKCVDMGQSVR